MNRWLMIGSLVGVLAMSTGCLHHNTRSGCNSCNQCQSCGDNCKSSGLLGKLGKGCKGAACPTSCVPGPLGWQQGGLRYGANICPHGAGAGHGAGAHGAGMGGAGLHGAAAQIQNQPFTPGPPSAQVAYPYYTHRGPRDFFLDDPPPIGR